MTNNERAELARLLADDVKKSVQEREAAKEKHGTNYLNGGYTISMQHSKEAVVRKITLLRQVLLEIKENL